MNQQDQHDPSDDELRARLRTADPAAGLPAAGQARVQELVLGSMADDGSETAAPAPDAPAPWRRWPALVAAAAVLVVGGVVGGLALADGDGSGTATSAGDASQDAGSGAGPDESDDPGGSGGGTAPSEAEPPVEGAGETALSLTAAAPPGTLRCRMVTVSALAGMETAFAGTVTRLGEDSVGFEVDRWYAGGDVDVVEVLNPPGFRAALEGPPPFEEGQRFLVTASEGQVTGCGFSAPYSEGLERMFERAFS